MTPVHGMLSVLNDLLLPFPTYFHLHCSLLMMVHLSPSSSKYEFTCFPQRTLFNAFYLVLKLHETMVMAMTLIMSLIYVLYMDLVFVIQFELRTQFHMGIHLFKAFVFFLVMLCYLVSFRFVLWLLPIGRTEHIQR